MTDRQEVGPCRRSLRDRGVDLAFCLLGGLTLVFDLSVQAGGPWPRTGQWPAVRGVDLAVGAAAGWLLWFRHRRPLAVALAGLPLCLLALPGPTHPASLALFSVAVHRPPRVVVPLAAAAAGCAPVYFLLRPSTALTPWTENALLSAASTLAVLGGGLLVRSRRAVLASLAERARDAETVLRLGVDAARRAERLRLAGEMNGVLVERLSRIAADAEDLDLGAGRAAGAVRATAHEALTDLRRVIALLRHEPDQPSPPQAGPPPPWPAPARQTRSWPGSRARLLDVVAVLAAAAWAATYGPALPADSWVSGTGRPVAVAFGGLAALALWWRRSHPLAVALVCVPLGAVAVPTGLVAALSATATLAARRPARTALLVVASSTVLVPVRRLVLDEPGADLLISLAVALTLLAAGLAWGMLLRSRSERIEILVDRAGRARRERGLRAALARQAERAALAREMHDVLAHRLSLVCMHAGVLEYRPHAGPDDVAVAVGVIRTNAARALEELHQVVELLADVTPTTGGGPGPAGPTLADLPDLLAAARNAGQRVHHHDGLADAAAVPHQPARTAYRVIQEGLTNARKHAPGTDVELVVDGAPGAGLDLRLSNLVPDAARSGSSPAEGGDPAPGPGAPAIPGTGSGLLGTGERVALAGGFLRHGRTADGRFEVHAWLPWPGERRDE